MFVNLKAAFDRVEKNMLWEYIKKNESKDVREKFKKNKI